ncbi:hypothetical protein B7463_g12468, partial [Scytalidium lignicola]
MDQTPEITADSGLTRIASGVLVSDRRDVEKGKLGSSSPFSSTSSVESKIPHLDDQNQRLPFSRLITIYLCLATCFFVSFLDVNSTTTALPAIATSLNAQNSITWAGTSYLIAQAAFQVLYGRFSDIFGRKPVLLFCVGILIVGDILCGFAQNPTWLYVCRALSGIGGGGISSLVQIIVSDLVSLKERGKYQGVLSGAIGLGSASGPFIAAAFLKTGPEGWRWAFWLPSMLAAVCVPVLLAILPAKPITGTWQEKVLKIDFLGLGSSVVAMLFILIPVNSGGSIWAWSSPTVISLLVIGSLSLAIFLGAEWKFARLPMMPLRLFTSRSQAIVFLQNFLFGFVWQADLYFLPIYYQDVRGYKPVQSAYLVLPLLLLQSVTGVLSGPAMSWMARFRPVLYVGFVFWVIGAGLKVLFSRTTPTGVYIAALLIEGAGVGLVFQPSLVALQALSKPEDRAVVTSTRNMLRAVGAAVGVAVSTAIQYGVMEANLPAALPLELRAQVLDGEWQIGDSSAIWTESILNAKMRGIRVVFITFVPLIGLCLFGCLLVKDKILSGDAKPKQETKEPANVPPVIESETAAEVEDFQVHLAKSDGK